MPDTRQHIVLATSNEGKIRELAEPLAAFGVTVLGLKAFPQLSNIEENGATFEENALIKARATAAASGLLCVADDSGLEVDALGGAPGIRSARYGCDWPSLPGESRDARNMRKLLHVMAAEENRTCRFVCCMAAVCPDGREFVVRGLWPGRLLREPRGCNGFGYDPIFFLPSLGKSAAELTRAEKNSRSHRGQALRALLAQWPTLAQ
ncbi:MAG: RdgB/HAM1 family non-canonical purine NTP pyrophosphatase [Desulfovibrio sp.]|nr:RdgB/HAM1 family non-canonical purine NTP pyrophosphatase [Desulfovibrio sp.]